MNRRFSRAFIPLILGVALLSACASQKTKPQELGAKSLVAKTNPSRNTAPIYRIGPGDMLQVFVWRNPALSVTVPVRPDGRISTPLDSDMSAVGKTPEGLANDIEKKLSYYIKDPTVNVIVTHSVSQFSRVSIVGQVRAPKSVPFEAGMTALDAVLDAGGPTGFAALKRALVIRHNGGERTEIHLNLHAMLDQGNMRGNIKLKAGDVVVVPESRF